MLNILKPVKVIAISAGKGGVGKSNIAVNLSVALAKAGNNVLLMDADLGLANIDIMLGLHAKYNLSHVISSTCDLKDIMLRGPEGISIIPAATGLDFMTHLSAAQHAGIVQSFSELTDAFDYMIIDTAAGISDTVLSFTRSAQELVVIACDEPASIADAYALIKIMSQRYHWQKFHLLTNMVRSLKDGRDVFYKLSRLADEFLEVQLNYLGAIPFDEHVHDALKKQKTVVSLYPDSIASKAITQLAHDIEHWPKQCAVAGNTSFFLERLVAIT